MEVTLYAVIFPACVVLLMASSLICSYGIAVAKGDVAAFWPYISDGAVLYPETNVFAQLLDMSAFAAFCTFCIRFLRMRELLSVGHVHSRRISVVAFFVGSLSLFGMTLVGNFQEDKPDHLHFLGAALLFLLGTAYAILDTGLSFVTRDQDGSSIRLCFSRVAIATTSTLFIVLSMVGKFVSENIWSAAYPDMDTKTRQMKQRNWTSHEPGYDLHVLGSTSEWVVGVMFIMYFLSFIADFRKLRFKLQVFVPASPVAAAASAAAVACSEEVPNDESRPFASAHPTYV